ncbi:unnamed protein product [Vicia faba]|uniref:Xylanase inhibitor N-terminal domain-containing protein n=1 Tax=Vicia faba TaxID=3906 RepID=A0AAV0YM10_VICFA|nr:unnamed protein product [Vicia faba]
MHSLKPLTFTLNILLLLLSLSSQKPLVDADIEQVNLRDQSSLSLNNNNNSLASESDEEDILKRSPSIEANITASNFTYLMKFGLRRYKGNRDLIYVNATPDTGSDLIWFHSKPCDYLLGCDCSCYYKGECITKPRHIFGCTDPTCKQLKNIGVDYECYQQNARKLCLYNLKYEDGAESKGFYGHADFQFTPGESDKTGEINEQPLSVGFATTKKEEDVPERNGMVGLGMGELSFIKQYGGIPKKFSYYLPQFLRQDEPEMKKKSNVPDCDGGDPKTYVCLTIEGQNENEGYRKRLRSYGKSKGEPQILGSRAQMDFTVAFDLGKGMKVSFENHEKVPDSGSVEKVSFENNEKISVLSE